MENMSEHEKYALMLSDHTPTTWGAEEEVSVPRNTASVNALITITWVIITLMVIGDIMIMTLIICDVLCCL